ncbi:1-acylglycerol-3-phosphate O-acyltransferase [Eubacterium sp. 14-2]|uniref:lysophospholipid acyltransferase family protein n=1 Tax=Eubacterium sp. 14-2 TaxID=1235790 RepID=UPI000334CCA9|nr:lysophospholipid acyltransferase family protein [Eubacterium sp. 14-2]EOT28249.1 1-acylglycerol-3-phosphate O-acyltransferase [Eubacterium sp. 14-2]
MIRIILVAVFLITFLILSIPVMIGEKILRKFNPYAADISSLRIVQWAFKVVLFIAGTEITVIGEEHVPKDQPVLYVPNHLSYFDIVITYSRCPGLTGYIAKDKMQRYPLLSTWMKMLYCLFLDRKDMREGLKMVLTGIDHIKHGISICIFPEGTRNPHPEEGMMPFKEGSLKMAEKTGCPVIPVAISNTHNIFESHMPFIRKCHVIVEYGEPVLIKELDKEQRKFSGAYTRSKIEEMLKKHQDML